MTRSNVCSAAVIIFVLLVIHCFFVYYTSRNAMVCRDKYPAMTAYLLRTVINALYVFADVSTLTALLMTCVYGIIKSRSSCTLIRCISDVRDALAMYMGCACVLTFLSCLCRTAEVYMMTVTPYDINPGFGVKDFIHVRGRLDNPEYNANAVSRYVAFATINFLITGFKVVVIMRLFDDYEKLCAFVELTSRLAKQRKQQRKDAAPVVYYIASS
ncbi:uncharacterized protein LOC144173999 isoform X2 [Haemaphysalis longicornis]